MQRQERRSAKERLENFLKISSDLGELETRLSNRTLLPHANLRRPDSLPRHRPALRLAPRRALHCRAPAPRRLSQAFLKLFSSLSQASTLSTPLLQPCGGCDAVHRWRYQHTPSWGRTSN